MPGSSAALAAGAKAARDAWAEAEAEAERTRQRLEDIAALVAAGRACVPPRSYRPRRLCHRRLCHLCHRRPPLRARPD